MASPTPPPLDLQNVQGDILVGGLPKKTQFFYLFSIDKNHIRDFRIQLNQLLPLITSNAQSRSDHEKIAEHKRKGDKSLLKMSGVNISFTQKGLATIGINDKIGDTAFDAGMLNGAADLGDKGTTSDGKFNPDWVPEFKQVIHGVILVTGDSFATADEKLSEIKKIFKVNDPQNPSIRKVIRIEGDVREGEGKKGHEHFGYLDGISQPAVKDVDTVIQNGTQTVRQGIILLGREGDTPIEVPARPSWALDGSFLAFRYLFQLVPEFDAFKKSKATPKLSDELLGARMVGRWKSGTPIVASPFVDDPDIGADPTRNNDFSYSALFPNDQSTQNRCPFAAHTRKTHPRADLESQNFPTEPRRIIRSGIPFGPELTAEEIAQKKTLKDRGLLFVAYQSNIVNGFQFIQQSWANATNFPFGNGKPGNPGFDPIIGQAPNGGVRAMLGGDPNNQGAELELPTQWVISKGGEYFFSPSIPALKQTFALAA